MINILPSLLSANLLALGKEIEAVVQAGATRVHLDVMDNHYVPNLTFGPDVCRAIHQAFPAVGIDVHLMVTPVETLIDAFAKAGAERISIHPDACTHLDSALTRIRQLGCQAGLALNPATSLDCLTYTQMHLDFVLVMSVNPGFGGQQFLPSALSKIQAIRQAYPSLEIAVDGGIGAVTLPQAAQAGAKTFIIGSALFSTPDYTKTMADLKQ